MDEWTLRIVKRSDTAKGFEVLPRRWVVERTFAWLGRCGRLAKDWEKSIASAEAWINVAHIRLTPRRLARYWYSLLDSESGSQIFASAWRITCSILRCRARVSNCSSARRRAASASPSRSPSLSRTARRAAL